MYISKIFNYILLTLLIFEFNCSDEDSKIKSLFNLTYIYTKNMSNDSNNNCYPENFLFGNIKFLDNNNIFYNIPRNNNYSMDINITFAKINGINSQITYDPWPNNTYNNISNMDNCQAFVSIIAFEFDNNNNIYILDEGNANCSIILYKFNSEGEELEKYIIFENNAENFNIIDFVLDKINDYVYITYYKNDYNNYDYDYDIGFIIKKLDTENKDTNIALLKDAQLKYDSKYIYSNDFIDTNLQNITKKLISTTLSCDGEFLFFTPVSSRMIYSIKTKKLRKIKNITLDDVNESYKNDANSAMISSNLGNLYLNGLEKNVIYIAGQIDKDLTIFDYKGVDKRETQDERQMGWPTKMSIYDGNLYIICKNITDIDNNTFTLITEVFELSIYKEKSYVYNCAGIGQKWNLETYIVWILFIIIVIFVLIFVFIRNKEDKDINKKD